MSLGMAYVLLYRQTLDYRMEAESVTYKYVENSFGHKTCKKFTECELAGVYILLIKI
jgi:hypothetical protein